MKHYENIFLSILFLGFIICFGAISIITPDRAISFNENRGLTQRPEVTIPSILDGTYPKQFEKYVTDQFAYRDFWIEAYMYNEILTNQTFVNDYLIAEDDWVYPKPINYTAPGAINESVARVKNMNDFLKKEGKEFYFFFLPDRKITVDFAYPSYTYKNLGQENKKIFLNRMPKDYVYTVDVKAEWDKKFTPTDYKPFYFLTDHHWNSKGAFYGYEVIHNAFAKNSSAFTGSTFDENDYEKICYDEKNFIGDYNKHLYRLIDPNEDSPVCYYDSKMANVDKWKVHIGDINSKSYSFYDVYGKIRKNDSTLVDYDDMYTNDLSQIHVINPDHKKDQTKALFIKDSYANPLLPFIAEQFYQTTFYDIRYNQGKDVYQYILEHDFDIVAILYNDSNIFKAMYEF